MKKILVTGVAGFIGSNMVELLLKNSDYEIIGIDNFQSGRKNEKFLKNLLENDRFKFFECAFQDVGSFLNEGIEIVYHFAATPRVLYSVEHPIETNENNVSNTLLLLNWCIINKVKRFVFSSSSSVYGNAQIFPTPETHNLNPVSPYALQKKIIEEYCKMYSNLYGLDTVCLRYFNVYGPNQYAENAYATVICSWIKALIKNSPIRIDGDGSQSRDFSYVTDVCNANFLVGERKDKFNGECFNVACNDSTNLLQIKSILASLFNKEIDVLKKETRIGDVFKTQADISKIMKIGFSPSVNIKEGIAKTFNWYADKCI